MTPTRRANPAAAATGGRGTMATVGEMHRKRRPRLRAVCWCGLVVAMLAACRPPGASSLPQARASEENRHGAADLEAGALGDAEQWFLSALSRSQRIDDAPGQAVALLNLARVDAERWALDRAAQRAERALALASLRPDLTGAAMATLAAIESKRGRHALAIDRARQAQALTESTALRRKAKARLRGDRSTTVAYTLIRAGGAYCREAEVLLNAAPGVYRRALGPSAEGALAHLHGQLALGRADPAAAQSAFSRALAIDRARGAAGDVADDLEGLATAAERAGQLEQARQWLLRALAVREAMDNPRRTLAVADRLQALGDGSASLQGKRALVRVEASDTPMPPPARARPCD